MNKYFIYRHQCPACNNNNCNVLCDAGLCDPPIRDYLDALYREVGPGVDFEYLIDARYKLVECDLCGLIYQAEVPNDDLLHKLYNEWLDPEVIKRNAQQRNTKHGLMMARETAKMLQYLGKTNDQIRFLDFGMGWGNWCLIAKAFGCDAYGAELGVENIQHAKQLSIKEVSWDNLPAQEFDIINSEQVFEHLREPLETLKYLRNSLADRGIIRINVPPAWDIKRRLKVWDWKASLTQTDKNSLNDAAPLQHINSFVRKSLIAMAEAAGLRAVKIPNVGSNSDKSLINNIKSKLKPFYKALMPNHYARYRENRFSRITCVYLVKS